MRFLQQNWKHDSWFKERSATTIRDGYLARRREENPWSREPWDNSSLRRSTQFSPGVGHQQGLSPTSGPLKAEIAPFCHGNEGCCRVRCQPRPSWEQTAAWGAPRCLGDARAMPAAMLLALGCSPLSARAGAPQLAFKCLSEDRANSYSVFTASQRVLACSRLLAAPEPVAYRCLKCSLIFQKAWESYLPVGQYTAMYFTYIHFTTNGGLRHYGNKNMIFEPCGSLMSCTLKTQ